MSLIFGTAWIYKLSRRLTATDKYQHEVRITEEIQKIGFDRGVRASGERITVGLVPFEWIEYTRDYDSEDSRPIIVCKFKGLKWYKNFKSPFKETSYMFKNPHYDKKQTLVLRGSRQWSQKATSSSPYVCYKAVGFSASAADFSFSKTL